MFGQNVRGHHNKDEALLSKSTFVVVGMVVVCVYAAIQFTAFYNAPYMRAESVRDESSLDIPVIVACPVSQNLPPGPPMPSDISEADDAEFLELEAGKDTPMLDDFTLELEGEAFVRYGGRHRDDLPTTLVSEDGKWKCLVWANRWEQNTTSGYTGNFAVNVDITPKHDANGDFSDGVVIFLRETVPTGVMTAVQEDLPPHTVETGLTLDELATPKVVAHREYGLLPREPREVSALLSPDVGTFVKLQAHQHTGTNGASEQYVSVVQQDVVVMEAAGVPFVYFHLGYDNLTTLLTVDIPTYTLPMFIASVGGAAGLLALLYVLMYDVTRRSKNFDL